jgi:hypothetical protein
MTRLRQASRACAPQSAPSLPVWQWCTMTSVHGVMVGRPTQRCHHWHFRNKSSSPPTPSLTLKTFDRAAFSWGRKQGGAGELMHAWVLQQTDPLLVAVLTDSKHSHSVC